MSSVLLVCPSLIASHLQDLDCLQQATADRAFTNAKQAGDINGQVAALIYRALERNTGKVGLVSTSCTGLQAVNPEIAAVQQHQVFTLFWIQRFSSNS